MRGWVLGTLFFSGIALTSSAASAYRFEEQCAPAEEHRPGFDAPNVMMVVDRSGSMAYKMPSDWTRWRTATTVIEEITADLERPGACTDTSVETCDPVRFGLGYFSSTGYLVVEPGEDNAAAIKTSLDKTYPSGGTQTHAGTEVFAASTELQDPNRPQIGVLITDGTPDGASTARAAVRQLCSLRERAVSPVVTYMVGFGAGSNQPVNGFMAAAGGTGTCCYGADFPCDPSFQVDPCAMSDTELSSAVRDTGVDDSTYIYADYNCGGSIEATDGEALKSALLEIAEDAACSFDLTIPADYPDGAASDDPRATWVEMNHNSYGNFRLPYCAPGDTNCGLDSSMQAMGVDATTASSYSNEGWYFPDNTRRWVRVTDGLCGEIQSRSVNMVVTQLACYCKFTGQDCTVEIEGFTNEQLQNMRCAQGVYECFEGEDICTAQYEPMPEICNGIDDDCDGSTDNMSDSWEKSEFQSAAYEIPDAFMGIECGGRDVCMCANGRDEVSGDDPQSFFASWSGGCRCGEGLDSTEANYTPAPPVEQDEAPQAACSSMGQGAGGSFLLFAFGAMVLRRRRRS